MKKHNEKSGLKPGLSGAAPINTSLKRGAINKTTKLFPFFFACCLLLTANCQLASAQTINTIAGTGVGGYSGDGGQATAATFNHTEAVAVDAVGNVYIVDEWNHRIRKVTISTGIISTIAGTGVYGYNGDGIAATTARLYYPIGLILDATGNVYIADTYNHRIRKIDITGMISTIAGTGVSGYNGDGIAATTATLNVPEGITVDAFGNVYIADIWNHRIRKIIASTGIISTIAGTGTAGYNGDGIAATAAQLNYPYGVALDPTDNVYVADESNHRIRKIDISTGIINTIAGTGTAGYNGDGIAATVADLNFPEAVVYDAAGNIYIPDAWNYRVRKITVSTGIINTIAGTGVYGFSGDGGAATAATLDYPGSVAIDTASCNMYIADENNNCIRVVTGLTGCTPNGIKENSINNQISISPNPFSTTATLTISPLERGIRGVSFVMYDLLSREVSALTLNPSPIGEGLQITRGNLQSGMYFYKVMSESKLIGTGKLIITNDR